MPFTRYGLVVLVLVALSACGQRVERAVVSGLCSPVIVLPSMALDVALVGPDGHTLIVHMDQQAWQRTQGHPPPLPRQQLPHAGALMLQISNEIEDLNLRLIGEDMTSADLDEAGRRLQRVRILLERLRLVSDQSGQTGVNPSVVYREQALEEL